MTLFGIIVALAFVYLFAFRPLRALNTKVNSTFRSFRALNTKVNPTESELDAEDAKEERKVQRAEAKAVRMTAYAAKRDQREEDRQRADRGRKAKRHSYWYVATGGRPWNVDRDRRFRAKYPTRRDRKAARRRYWES
jgi:hypothetical protein